MEISISTRKYYPPLFTAVMSLSRKFWPVRLTLIDPNITCLTQRCRLYKNVWPTAQLCSHSLYGLWKIFGKHRLVSVVISFWCAWRIPIVEISCRAPFLWLVLFRCISNTMRLFNAEIWIEKKLKQKTNYSCLLRTFNLI